MHTNNAQPLYMYLNSRTSIVYLMAELRASYIIIPTWLLGPVLFIRLPTIMVLLRITVIHSTTALLRTSIVHHMANPPSYRTPSFCGISCSLSLTGANGSQYCHTFSFFWGLADLPAPAAYEPMWMPPPGWTDPLFHRGLGGLSLLFSSADCGIPTWLLMRGPSYLK